MRHTDRSFIAERMEDIIGIRIPLFVSPNQINPIRQVLADIIALESLYAQIRRSRDRISRSNAPFGAPR